MLNSALVLLIVEVDACVDPIFQCFELPIFGLDNLLLLHDHVGPNLQLQKKREQQEKRKHFYSCTFWIVLYFSAA